MMEFRFQKEQLANFQENIKKEWVMTNGIGGYSGTSILGALGRTHQGYLIASLHAPVERYLVFAKTNECFTQNQNVFDLETSQHAGAEIHTATVSSSEVPDAYKSVDTVSVASDFVAREANYKEGQKYLEVFCYDGTVTYLYKAGDLTLTKSLTLVQGQNICAISYHIENKGADAKLRITPLMNYREHSGSSTPESLQFHTVRSHEIPVPDADKKSAAQGCHFFTLVPDCNPDVQIRMYYSEGELRNRLELYDLDTQLATEVELETPGLDTHFTPYDLMISIPAGATKDISLVCEILTGNSATAFPAGVTDQTSPVLIAKQKAYLSELIAQSGADDDFSKALVLASNQFLSYRESTGLTTVLAGLPWFTDWGRDTMIAFSGLTLATKRYREAQEILLTFAKYIHHGLVPNMFPDDGQAPLYNTADASLWYFYAVYQYLTYVDTNEAYEFIRDEIYPGMKQIIAAYRTGTDFSIYMDKDSLIHAGSGNDQVTWMDVRVGDWVVTPRHGKPVEINALWYNALKVMELLSKRFGDTSFSYGALAEEVKASFVHEFWNEKDGCLYDVVGDDGPDASLRPNQIYAVSLPFTMLTSDQEKSIVDLVLKKLYAGTGLRSLSPEADEYHPIYCGSLPKRDAAYHQGTSWGYLLGGFITAYVKVHGHTPEAILSARKLLEPVQEHLLSGCIGSVSEIFDGDAPHTCRGCYAQAWSVGEILRCYHENLS